MSIEAPHVTTPTLSTSAMLVDLSIGTWSGRKKDKKASSDVTTNAGALSGAANVNKVLLPTCKELDAIRKHAANTRNTHYTMTLPWAADLRLVATKSYADYHAAITGAMEEYYVLVDEFLNVYETELLRARDSLGSLFNETEYPAKESLRRRFYFQLAYMPVPESGDIRVDLATEQAELIKTQYAEFYNSNLELAMNELWHRLYEALSKMSERLDYESDGTKKIFRDTLVSNVMDVVKMLDACNFAGSSQMVRMRERLEDALLGISAESLRHSEGVRLETKSKIDAALADFPQIDWE